MVTAVLAMRPGMTPVAVPIGSVAMAVVAIVVVGCNVGQVEGKSDGEAVQRVVVMMAVVVP